MKKPIYTFKKAKLTHDEAGSLYGNVLRIARKANIAEMSDTLTIFEDKITYFHYVCHPEGWAPETLVMVNTDSTRDELIVCLTHFLEYGIRHPDGNIRAAAQELYNVIKLPVYKGIYNKAYERQSNLIEELVDSITNYHANAVTTLNLGTLMSDLSIANTDFKQAFYVRSGKKANSPHGQDVLDARNAMEHAYDLTRNQLILLSEIYGLEGHTDTGGGGGAPVDPNVPDVEDVSTYQKLFNIINQYIKEAMIAAERRIAAARAAREKKEKEKEEAANQNPPANNSNPPADNNGGEAGNNTPPAGDDNGNTDANDNNNNDPNAGEDNTPSANA